jgi:hypothetical protein
MSDQKYTAEEQSIIALMEKGRDQPMTEREIAYGLDQAYTIGELSDPSPERRIVPLEPKRPKPKKPIVVNMSRMDGPPGSPHWLSPKGRKSDEPK